MVAATLAVVVSATVLATGAWQPRDEERTGATTAPGAGDVEVDASGAGRDAGTWSPGTEPGSAAEAGSAADRGPTCEVAGCALWRSTVLDHRPLLAADGRLVQLGLELLIAVDADTGRWLWQQGHDDPRGVSPPAAISAAHLDERSLVIAYGTRLRIHAVDSGRVRGEVDLAPTQISDLRRHDGQLIATGQVRGADPPRTRVVGLADDGRVRFDTEVEQVLREQAPATGTTAPLLVRTGGDLVRLDATEGSARWRRDASGRRLDGTTLLDPASGEVVVVGTRDGRDLLRLRRPGAVAAGVRDGLLIVTFPDRIELHDRDGIRLGEVPVSDPRHTVVVAAGRRVTVAELPADRGGRPLVRSGRRSGGATALPTTTRAATVPVAAGERPAEVSAMRRPDGLLLAGPTPQDAWVVDPVAGSIAPLGLEPAPDAEVVHADGLTLVREGQRVTVIGAAGRVGVARAPQLAATDPLVLHGGAGVLRLDRAPLDGADQGRERGASGAPTPAGAPQPVSRAAKASSPPA